MLFGLLLERRAGVGILVVGVGKELHRLDVGVAVDDAAEQCRARLGRFRRALANVRDKAGNHRAIGHEPHKQRDDETRIGGPEQRDGAQPLHGDKHRRIAQHHERVAQCRCGLHQLIGDAAGELVLEEAETLPQHVGVGLPSHAGLERRRQDLALEKLVHENDRRSRNEHDERHPQQKAGVIAKKARGRRRRFHHVDQLRDEGREQHLTHRCQEIEEENKCECRPDWLDEVPIEGDERTWRHGNGPARKRINAIFKPAKHETVLVDGPQGPRKATQIASNRATQPSASKQRKPGHWSQPCRARFSPLTRCCK